MRRKSITKEATLPPSHQLVITLREGLNLTFEQIASIMMLPVDAVRSLWEAARQLRHK